MPRDVASQPPPWPSGRTAGGRPNGPPAQWSQGARMPVRARVVPSGSKGVWRRAERLETRLAQHTRCLGAPNDTPSREAPRLTMGLAVPREDDLVFTDLNGGPFPPGRLSQGFDRRVKDAGLPRIRFLDLAHPRDAGPPCWRTPEAGERAPGPQHRLYHAGHPQPRHSRSSGRGGGEGGSAGVRSVTG